MKNIITLSTFGVYLLTKDYFFSLEDEAEHREGFFYKSGQCLLDLLVDSYFFLSVVG